MTEVAYQSPGAHVWTEICLQLVFARWPLHHATPPGAAAAEVFALQPDEAHKIL